MTTRAARIRHWQAWKKGQVEGVFARYLDEWLLRRSPGLAAYWRHRNWGRMPEAVATLQRDVASVTPQVQFETSRPDVRTHIAMRIPDLLLLTAGGCAHDVSMYSGSDSLEQVIAASQVLDAAGLDSGTVCAFLSRLEGMGRGVAA
jgi:hypothetical protein